MKIALFWKGSLRANSYTYERIYLKLSQIAYDMGISTKYLGAAVIPTLNKRVMLIDIRGELKDFPSKLKELGFDDTFIEVVK